MLPAINHTNNTYCLSTQVTIAVKSLLFLHDWKQEVLMPEMKYKK